MRARNRLGRTSSRGEWNIRELRVNKFLTCHAFESFEHRRRFLQIEKKLVEVLVFELFAVLLEETVHCQRDGFEVGKNVVQGVAFLAISVAAVDGHARSLGIDGRAAAYGKSGTRSFSYKKSL